MSMIHFSQTALDSLEEYQRCEKRWIKDSLPGGFTNGRGKHSVKQAKKNDNLLSELLEHAISRTACYPMIVHDLNGFHQAYPFEQDKDSFKRQRDNYSKRYSDWLARLRKEYQIAENLTSSDLANLVVLQGSQYWLTKRSSNRPTPYKQGELWDDLGFDLRRVLVEESNDSLYIPAIEGFNDWFKPDPRYWPLSEVGRILDEWHQKYADSGGFIAFEQSLPKFAVPLPNHSLRSCVIVHPETKAAIRHIAEQNKISFSEALAGCLVDACVATGKVHRSDLLCQIIANLPPEL